MWELIETAVALSLTVGCVAALVVIGTAAISFLMWLGDQ